MNRLVFITGIFGGIGYATARKFKEKGWDVAGMDIASGEDSSHAVDVFFPLDGSKKENVAKARDHIAEKYGKLDCLVNNAALQICKSMDDTTEEEWELVFQANIKANFLFAKYMHPLLKAARGSIVNASSVHAFATSKNIGAYAASKGAILAFTRSVALEFADDGIRVNAVLPGAVDTGMLRAGLSRGNFGGKGIEKRMAALAKKTPLQKIGTPEEIAKAIYFLGDSEWSSFITGQSLIVDGGVLAQLSSETEG